MKYREDSVRMLYEATEQQSVKLAQKLGEIRCFVV